MAIDIRHTVRNLIEFLLKNLYTCRTFVYIVWNVQISSHPQVVVRVRLYLAYICYHIFMFLSCLYHMLCLLTFSILPLSLYFSTEHDQSVSTRVHTAARNAPGSDRARRAAGCGGAGKISCRRPWSMAAERTTVAGKWPTSENGNSLHDGYERRDAGPGPPPERPRRGAAPRLVWSAVQSAH